MKTLEWLFTSWMGGYIIGMLMGAFTYWWVMGGYRIVFCL